MLTKERRGGERERTCCIVDFAVLADYEAKSNEMKKRDKCLELAWELRKLWNIRVTVMPTLIGAFGTVPKWLEKEMEELETGGQLSRLWHG